MINATPKPLSAQTWDASAYAANGRFVATMATEVVRLLDARPGERILDAGCGDGALTEQLGPEVHGVDASETMVTAARARGLTVDHASMTDLPYRAEFDAVFSNAALHWIPFEAQPLALAGLYRALKPGGRLVAEMGGQGNIAAIRVALASVLGRHGLDAEQLAASFYPSAQHYQAMLQAAGFQVDTIAIFPRPTPLPGGAEGMTRWLNTFRNGVLDLLPADAREEAVRQTVELLKPALADPFDDSWTADYVRLRFRATKIA